MRKFINLFYKTINYISFYRIGLAATAACTAWAWSIVLDIPKSSSYVPLIFFLTFGGYNLNYLTDTKEDEVNIPQALKFWHGKSLNICLLIVFPLFFAFYLSFLGGWPIFLLTSFIFCLGLSYTLHWLPSYIVNRFHLKYDRLKGNTILKAPIVALGWGLLCIMLPAIYAGCQIKIDIWIVFFYTMTIAFIQTTLYDIRDMGGDSKARVMSIPLIIGTDNTLRILNIVNLISTIIFLLGLIAGYISSIGYLALFYSIFIGATISLWKRKILEPRFFCDLFIISGVFFTTSLGLIAFLLKKFI